MRRELNPFHELYVTETAEPDEFVRIFSPFLIKHSLPLFQPGNVVLKGTQGTGKSMLLNLLRPEVRRAYFDANLGFPISKALSAFVGAGINLTRSGAGDIGQRPFGRDKREDQRLFPLYFADFTNYWIVNDILSSIKYMAAYGEAFENVVDCSDIDNFARFLARQDCWFGYLGNVSDFVTLELKIKERINIYRSFHQYNIKELPSEIGDTKTRTGEPISNTAECLWAKEIIPLDVPIYIRIDQYEVLADSDDLRRPLGIEYRRIINKALGSRDPRISYRIGTRGYAWKDDLNVFATTRTLENERDFRIVDLDDILRRRENPSTYVFPRFARDIFERRLRNSGFEVQDNALRTVMGRTRKPAEAAQYYVGKSRPVRALKIEKVWPQEWSDYLFDLFKTDPLSAKLAEAWLRQRGSDPKDTNRFKQPPPTKNRPWERTYWKKERHRQALMQLAARCSQRLVWSGEENILALSTGSTLVFVSICQHIWDAHLRSQLGKPKKQQTDPAKDGIDENIQAIGIQTASAYWYEKITEQPGGSDRQRFIDVLGRRFYISLINDLAMSYPGHNGFSVRVDEMDSDEIVRGFLREAVDYGDLYDASHTTKEKSARKRIKYYLNPVLSPYFRIPESHIKEPIYAKMSDVRSWMTEAGILQNEPQKSSPGSKSTSSNVDDRQLTLLLDDVEV